MTNNESKRAWHRLGHSIYHGDCRFSAVNIGTTKGSHGRQQACGHGYRQQDQTHLPDVGQQLVGLATGRMG